MAGPMGINEEVFKAFAFYAGILLFKMVLMSPLTGFIRVINKVNTTEYERTFII